MKKKYNRHIITNPLKKCLFLLSVFILFQEGNAQTTQARQLIRQKLIWLRLESRLFFTPRWTLYSEAEERRFIFPGAHHHFITRSSLHYTLNNNWIVGGGMAYSLQSPQDPRAVNRLVVPEWRPHVEVINRNPLGTRFLLNHQYRFEYRMIHNANQVELLTGLNKVFRFRYRIELNYFIRKRPNDIGNLRWRLANEVMLNAGRNVIFHVFDQNRIYTGLNYQATKNIGFEIAYLKWFQQRSSGYQYWNRDIFRFIIQHQVRFYEKQPSNK